MKPTIPYPDNPLHTDNLCTTQLLEAQEFEGPDACMRISTLEYGAAWRTLPDGRLLFIYGIRRSNNTDCDYSHFDRTTLAPDYDVFKEHDWVDWSKFFDGLGVDREEWSQYPLSQKLYDLLEVYGHENIFGTSYWEGFRIFDHCELINCHNDPSRVVKMCVKGIDVKEFMLCEEHAKQLEG